MPKLFATMDVGQVNLDKGDRDRGEGIAQCDTGVCQGARVDDQEMGSIGAGSVNAVDQRAFVIALEKSDIRTATTGTLAQFALDVVEAARAVNMGFPRPEQVEIGAIDNEYRGLHEIYESGFRRRCPQLREDGRTNQGAQCEPGQGACPAATLSESGGRPARTAASGAGASRGATARPRPWG